MKKERVKGNGGGGGTRRLGGDQRTERKKGGSLTRASEAGAERGVGVTASQWEKEHKDPQKKEEEKEKKRVRSSGENGCLFHPQQVKKESCRQS